MTNTDGGFGSSGWQILEHEDSYDESVLQCGGHVEVDDALLWLDFFLNRNPLVFHPVRSGSDIRVAKTKLRIKGTKVHPAYKLLFTVNEAAKTVTKLHVSPCQPEEMPFADPWDDEGPPF